MELRHLRYFVAVAEELNFTRAAARLHIGQPPLSMQIRDLEGEMGVRLFERTQRRVALTPAGQCLLEHAYRILGGVREAVEAAQRAASWASCAWALPRHCPSPTCCPMRCMPTAGGFRRSACN